jgi:hypothetical protein
MHHQNPGSNTEPCPVRAIVFLTYDPAAHAGIERVAPLEAVQRLLEDNVWLGHPLEESSVRRFLDWLAGTPCFAVRFSDLADAHALISDHVA